MAKMPTCPVCELAVEKSDISNIFLKKRWYHAHCVDANKGKTQNDKKEFAEFIDWVMTKGKIEQPRGFIEKQVKDMVEEGMKLGGLKITAWYYLDILGKEIKKHQGVNILAHYYWRAANFYKIRQANNPVILKEDDMETVIVAQANKREVKQINFEELGGV